MLYGRLRNHSPPHAPSSKFHFYRSNCLGSIFWGGVRGAKKLVPSDPAKRCGQALMGGHVGVSKNQGPKWRPQIVGLLL